MILLSKYFLAKRTALGPGQSVSDVVLVEEDVDEPQPECSSAINKELLESLPPLRSIVARRAGTCSKTECFLVLSIGGADLTSRSSRTDL